MFVRPIPAAEGQRLQRLARRSRDAVTVRRAAIVLCSAQEMSVPQIADPVFADPKHIRSVLKDFNSRGFEALQAGSHGRPRRFSEQDRERIVEIALSKPKQLGKPFTHRSLAKLREHLIETGVVASISAETVRRILAERGVSFQRTKTWKESPDPEFEGKKTAS
ncbi:MAG: helix-turn-helix domain-containing protein [Solirubrobacterales bacterium]